MNRLHPFMTTLGFLFTALFLAGLAVIVWRSGGAAFSPGGLSSKAIPGVSLAGFASHAQFETECSRCHQPLETTQSTLCVVCHANVGDQISHQTGAHGKIRGVARCATCHSDHQGRDFDPTQAALAHFDHSLTRFTLVWHQVGYDMAPLTCNACHSPSGGFQVDDDRCADCHRSKQAAFIDAHIASFGPNCADCHDGSDRMVGFDHSRTQFPLAGRHEGLSCVDCHGLGKPASGAQLVSVNASAVGQLTFESFQNTSKTCAACHAQPDLHKGMFDSACETCHNTVAWKPAKLGGKPFDHEAVTHFSLARHQTRYDGKAFACVDCHPNGVNAFDARLCADCHAQDPQAPGFIEKHIDKYTPACLDCHDGADRMSRFNHAQVFPLDGAHASIECVACHVDKVFHGTPSACAQCHKEPDIHAGFFGLQCQYCHSSAAWTPAGLRFHIFPVDHGERGEIACQTCHTGKYTQYTCYGCHDHQLAEIQQSHAHLGIPAADLPDCARCHPTGLVDKNTPEPALGPGDEPNP